MKSPFYSEENAFLLSIICHTLRTLICIRRVELLSSLGKQHSHTVLLAVSMFKPLLDQYMHVLAAATWQQQAFFEPL